MNGISKDTKKIIEQSIADIESKSDAEIRVVVAGSCDRYRYSIFIYSLFATLLVPFAVKVAGIHITQTNLTALVVATFLFVSFVLEYGNIKYRIIPKKVKKDRCEKMALTQFYKLGIDKTKNHKAILLFVSLNERYIRVVADENIQKKIKNNIWQGIVREFLEYAKNAKVDEGLVHITKKCGKILKDNFPKTNMQKENELNNEVVEI